MQSATQAAMQAQGYIAKNFYTYLTGFTSALANGNATSSSINIDGDSDFFLTKITAFAQIGSDGFTFTDTPIPGISVVITNTTTGRNYMNAPTPIPCIAGSGALPFIIPIETFFAAKSTITFAYQNITDDTTYSALYLALIGIKAYK